MMDAVLGEKMLDNLSGMIDVVMIVGSFISHRDSIKSAVVFAM